MKPYGRWWLSHLWIKVCTWHNFLSFVQLHSCDWFSHIKAFHHPFCQLHGYYLFHSSNFTHVVLLICVFQFPPYVLRFCKIPSIWSKFCETQLLIWPLLFVLSISIHEQTCFHPSSSFISMPNYMCDKVSWTQGHVWMIQNCIRFEFNPPIISFVDALFHSFSDSSGQSHSWTKFIRFVWGLCCCHLFFPRGHLGKWFTCTNTKRKKKLIFLP